MTAKEQTDAFASDIDSLVERYAKEFDLSYAQVVGVLHMKIHLLCQDASERDDDET